MVLEALNDILYKFREARTRRRQPWPMAATRVLEVSTQVYPCVHPRILTGYRFRGYQCVW